MLNITISFTFFWVNGLFVFILKIASAEEEEKQRNSLFQQFYHYWCLSHLLWPFLLNFSIFVIIYWFSRKNCRSMSQRDEPPVCHWKMATPFVLLSAVGWGAPFLAWCTQRAASTIFRYLSIKTIFGKITTTDLGAFWTCQCSISPCSSI